MTAMSSFSLHFLSAFFGLTVTECLTGPAFFMVIDENG
jgi:hypothetical protein